MLSADIPFAPRSQFHRHGSGQITPAASVAESSHSQTPQSQTPHARAPSGAAPRFESLLDRSTQFERLIAGQETEAGEAPPAYEDAVAT